MSGASLMRQSPSPEAISVNPARLAGRDSPSASRVRAFPTASPFEGLAHQGQTNTRPPRDRGQARGRTPDVSVEAEGQHRDQAIIEELLADWNDGPLAHLPSGEVHRQRGLAGHRRHRLQPAARGRRPAQPRLRQSPRRHQRPQRPPEPEPRTRKPGQAARQVSGGKTTLGSRASNRKAR